MGLEAATYISQLNPANPVGAVDPKAQGDDHLRMIKAVLQASFPTINGALTPTLAQLNAVGASGITGFAIPTNKVKGSVAASAGAATTALRSDVQLILDLADNYAWTGNHSYTQNLLLTANEFRINAASPYLRLTESVGSANNKEWLLQASGNALKIRLANDAFAAFADMITMNRSGNTPGSIVFANSQIQIPDGNTGSSIPGICFSADTDTGFGRSASDTLNILLGGGNAYILTAAVFSAAGVWRGPDGAIGAPAVSFGSDTDTGIWRSGADALSFSEGGVASRIGYRALPVSSTTTTFAIGDVGKCVPITTAINIPASVFAAGDIVSVYNDSAGALNVTISAGTLRLSGSALTGTRALQPRAIGTLWFRTGGATPEVIASGGFA